MPNPNSLLLVGAGPMAVEYAKILRDKDIAPIVVGRGAASSAKFEAETGVKVHAGGLQTWLEKNVAHLPSHAIVAVGERAVGDTTMALLDAGVRSILVEKPGGFAPDDIREVGRRARELSAYVAVGYNRRFFASVDTARRIIAEDGGVKSFNFEFTEWGHVIGGLIKEEGVKEQWFLSNSTHVIDLAFHLGGKPTDISTYTAGHLDWHSAGAIFAGAGKTDKDALFSYQANWSGPGRWGVEVLTAKHRLYFRPMEKLHIQKIGSVAIEPVEIDDKLDQLFKPGLYKQFEAFLATNNAFLPTIEQQVDMLDIYLRMRGA